MLRNLKELHGYTIVASDGDIGRARDFYFDDQLWTVRYLVVNTGRWLSNRQVLISSAALGKPNWGREIFPVSLSKEQIKSSSTTDMHKPVSRQHEHELHTHYGWPRYWDPGTFAGEIGISIAEYEFMEEVAEEEEEYEEAVAEEEEQEDTSEEEEEDSHLQSAVDVTGYHIHATNGQIGHVDDFIIDDESWAIRYIVVDTRNWLPGKRVLVSPHWIRKVIWLTSEVYVNLQREIIKDSPEFDPGAPINRDYENRLYDYYGRRKYWTEQVSRLDRKG